MPQVLGGSGLIFITVGTQLPFDRLVRAMDSWCAANPSCKVFGQIAELRPNNYRPDHFGWVEKMNPAEFDAHFSDADLVVAHAGMGTIITALTVGKPLIIMPRMAELGEHRSEHQSATASHFGNRPGIWLVDDERALHSALHEASDPPVIKHSVEHLADQAFTDALQNYIISECKLFSAL